MSKLEQMPPSDSHRLVPIQSYSLHPGIVNGTWILVVEGTAACANMTVTLEPAVYIRQPEYWRIEAVGTVPGGFCLPATRPYAATLPLAGATGSKGIELVGQGYSERIEVPPQAEPQLERVLQVGSVSLAVLESHPRQLLVSATGTASTPGWTAPQLRPRPFGDALPADGILELDFLADPPEGMVPQVLAPIQASYRWPDLDRFADALRGVRVHARTNAVEEAYSEGPAGPVFQQQVELPLDRAVAVDDGGLGLTLVGVQDSRCPSNVVCVWQGFVVAEIEATPKGSETQKIELSSMAEGPVELPGGYRLSLVNVMPYPVAGQPPAHDPVATVLVMRT